jgi:hypothetical protein
LQVLLFLVEHGPVGQVLTVWVPMDTPSQQGESVVTLSPSEHRPDPLI